MTATLFNRLIAVVLVCGALLRLLLWWTNPPENTHDDHLTPILLVMETGSLPASQDCWQCYHPPVFYVFSALAGKVIVRAGLDFAKTQQLLPCLFGILTLWFIHLLLGRTAASRPAHILALGAAAFLPMHIYISAMHTNDTLAGLGVAVCLYLSARVLRTRFDRKWLLFLGAAVLLTIHTRHTSMVVLPVMCALCAGGPWIAPAVSRRRAIASAAVLVLVPLASIPPLLYKNQRETGTPLPFNQELFGRDPAKYRPGGDRIEFFTFRPRVPAAWPILTEDWIDSYWTATYAGFWFDVNPFFISYTDPARPYWSRYKRYLEDLAEPPPSKAALSSLTLFCGRALLLLGLPVLVLCIAGMAYGFRRRPPDASPGGSARVVHVLCLVLLAFNVAGMIRHNMHYPIYTSMKAAYYLPSLPALILFLALGVEAVWRGRPFRKALAGVFACLFFVSAVHTAHIALAQKRWMRADALNREGLALAGEGRPAEAAAVYRRILDRDHRFIEARINLGNALADLGRPEQAAFQYHEARRLDPEHPPIYINLALARLDQGRWREAVAHLKRALALDPDDASARRLLDRALAVRPAPNAADAVPMEER